MPTISGLVDGENDSPVWNGSLGGPTPAIMSSDADEPCVPPQKKGKKGKGKWTRKTVEHVPLDVPARRGVGSLKLTVSGPGIAGADLVPDPNERRYCYCNQVSFGEVCCQVEQVNSADIYKQMIACDSDACQREWFHLDCVGLTKAPSNKSNWYCRDCSAS